MIPFSPPRIDSKIIDSVNEALLSGWITTGPKTKLFEKKLTEFTSCKSTLCVASASGGMELMLRWFGVGAGDEVIVPAYTYAATANVVVHTGAKVIFADVKSDFNIDVEDVRSKITSKTKVIMPVDLGGFPCDYNEINSLVNDPEIIKLFSPANDVQQKLGRIFVLSDAAHSLGAFYNGKRTGTLTDVTVFSFHAVKNLTTAEGGAIALNLPEPFNNDEVYKYLNIKSLHGQTKDALAKTQVGNWRYDIIEPGYKWNMTDMQAAIGLVELERYQDDMLQRRRQIFEDYSRELSKFDFFEIPEYETTSKTSSFHVFLLRIKNVTEAQRDKIMANIFAMGVSVNVHFIPLPLMTYYKSIGYNIDDFPVALDNYSREISLPVYYNLTDEQIKTVINAVVESSKTVINNV